MKIVVLLSALALIHCSPGNLGEILEVVIAHREKGRKPTVPDPDLSKADSLILYSIRDVHVDEEDKNTGLGSEVRLYYPEALALVAFDTFPEFPAGKKLVKAELALHGWSDAPDDADVTFDLFETSGDWKEGTGHWYVHSGKTHNGFESVYAQFPEYVPPAGTTDPVSGGGIVWSESENLRNGMVKITTAKAVFPRGFPWGCYPRLEHTGAVVFDLTEYLAKHYGPGKALSVGIRQASGATAVNEGNSWIYSRNHIEPKLYGPRLVLRFK